MRPKSLIKITFLFFLFLAGACKDDKTKTDIKPSVLAEISDVTISNITLTEATFKGSVIKEGASAVILRGFCWSKNEHPTVADNYSQNAFGPGEYTYTVKGLAQHTTYYVRAYATNGDGTVYGNEISFKTLTIDYQLGGKGPAGGDVFYLDGQGGGMESSPSANQSNITWGCLSKSIPGTGVEVGKGRANTTIIAEACTEQNIAAKWCDNLTVGTFNDWYLPSKDELGLIYTNLAAKSIGGFTPAPYWSSSEQSATNACVQDMGNGTKGALAKASIYFVRAVRSF